MLQPNLEMQLKRNLGNETPGTEDIESDVAVTGEDALKYIRKNMIK